MSLRIGGIIYCTSALPVNFKLCLVEGNPVRNRYSNRYSETVHFYECCFKTPHIHRLIVKILILALQIFTCCYTAGSVNYFHLQQ